MEVQPEKKYVKKELKDYDLLTTEELEQEHKDHKKREHDLKVQSFLDKHQKNVMGSH